VVPKLMFVLVLVVLMLVVLMLASVSVETLQNYREKISFIHRP
jgi:hypothetical protein